MTDADTRNASRDSLFLLATVWSDRGGEEHRVRVRNLSDGGMMGEGAVRVQRGDRLEIELRNIGRITGSIAWVQDNRFGVAFDEEIDSQRARKAPEQSRSDDPTLVGRSWTHRAPPPPDPKTLRKI